MSKTGERLSKELGLDIDLPAAQPPKKKSAKEENRKKPKLQRHNYAKEMCLQAIYSTRPMVIEFATHGKAMAFRQSCYMMRLADRQAAAELCEAGDEGYGVSAFDNIRIEVRDKKVTLYNDPPPKISWLEEVENVEDE